MIPTPCRTQHPTTRSPQPSPRRAGSPPTADARRRTPLTPPATRTPLTPPATRRPTTAEDEDEESDGEESQRRRRRDRSPRRRRRRRGGRRRRRGGSADGEPDSRGNATDGDESGDRDTNVAVAAATTAEQHVSDEDGSAGPTAGSAGDQRTRSGARTDRSEWDRRRRVRSTTPTTPPRTVSAAAVAVGVVAARTAPRRPTTRPRWWSGSASRAPAEGGRGGHRDRRLDPDGGQAPAAPGGPRGRPPPGADPVSEAEFLARRESVARKMIIRQREDLSQIAVLEDDILVEHYVDRDRRRR